MYIEFWKPPRHLQLRFLVATEEVEDAFFSVGVSKIGELHPVYIARYIPLQLLAFYLALLSI